MKIKNRKKNRCFHSKSRADAAFVNPNSFAIEIH